MTSAPVWTQDLLAALAQAAEGLELGSGKNRHYYMQDGVAHARLTSVLNVLGKPALPAWYAKQERAFVLEYAQEALDNGHSPAYLAERLAEQGWAGDTTRDEAADVGTDGHARVAEWVRELIADNDPFGQPDPEDHVLTRARKLILRRGLVPLACEVRLRRRDPNVAGTCDYLFYDPSDDSIVAPDLKTGNHLYESHIVQAGGYCDLIEATGVRVKPALIHVPAAKPDDAGRWLDLPHDAAVEAWRTTLALWLQNKELSRILKGK